VSLSAKVEAEQESDRVVPAAEPFGEIEKLRH
jgi:hypothetical protein